MMGVALVLAKNPRSFLDRFSHEKLERNTKNRVNRKRRRSLGRRKKHGRP